MIEHNSSDNRCRIQIQPQVSATEVWKTLAETEDLDYEIIEFSLPPALNEGRRLQTSLEWYLASDRVRSIHGVFIDVNPASGDLEFRALSRKRCSQSCELARKLGAQNVVFHSSCATFLRGAYLEAWAGECARFYEELAETYDLHLFIENSQDIDPVPLQQLMKNIKDPRIGVCLDLGHVNYSRSSLDEWLDVLGEWIGYFHLSDNMGTCDDHLPIGQGTVDWKTADRFWRSMNRPCPATLEVGGPDGVRSSLTFMRKHELFGR